MDPDKQQDLPDQPETKSVGKPKRRRSATTDSQGSPKESLGRPSRRPRSAEPLSDDEKRLRARERYHERKARLTAEQQKAITEKQRQTKAKNRANETPEQQKARNLQNAKAMAARRANETPEQHQVRNQQNAKEMAKSRANETPEQQQIRKKLDAQAKSAKKNQEKSHVNFKDAFRSQEIMEGKLRVLALEDTEDAIGPMNHICRWCKALKFKGETMSSCCGGPVDGKPPVAYPKWYLKGYLYQRQKRIVKLLQEEPIGYERQIEMIEGLCKGCKVNWCEMYQRCDCEELCNHVKLSKCCKVKYLKLCDKACKCDD